MNKFFYRILMVFILLVVFSTQAAPPRPPGVADKAPIDAGLSLLLIAGSVFGIQKLRKK